ncbi:MAG: hypothetical protein ACRDGT_11800 [Candidatus Limnocylindria bacterium]
MNGPKRLPWEDEFDGSLSPDWIVGMIVAAILVFALLGVWINDMYANRYGIFGP